MSWYSRRSLNIKAAVSLLSLGIFFIFGVVLLTMQYNSNKELAINATEKIFMNISNQLANEMQKYEETSKNAIELIEVLHEKKSFTSLDEKSMLMKSLTKHIEQNPFIYSFYLGNKNGEFYQVINLEIFDDIKSRLLSPDDARWTVVKIDNRGDKMEYFLDSKLNLVDTFSTKTAYNPSHRPWFQQSMQSENITKTQPYEFTSLRALGITYSKKVDDNIVIGLDIALESLQTILMKQKLAEGSEIFLFNQYGQVIANNLYGNIMHQSNSMLKKFYTKLFMNKTDNINEAAYIEFRDEQYLQYYHAIDQQNKNSDYLAILSLKSSIMKPYNEEIIKNIFISLGVFLLICVPVLLYIFKMVVNPIKKVASINKQIENEDFDEVKHVPTFISELDDISVSLNVMSDSVTNYKKSKNDLMLSYVRLSDARDKERYARSNEKLRLQEESNRRNSRKDELLRWINDCDFSK